LSTEANKSQITIEPMVKHPRIIKAAGCPRSSAGIGHNQLPEPLEIELSDIEELTQSVYALKAQPESPPDKGGTAQAVITVESKASKLREWAERRGEEFASEAAKAAGKQVGTWLTGAFVIWLVDQILGLSHVARMWLDALISK